MRVVHRVSRFALVTVVGGVLVAAGIVMLVTPGPGLLAIVGGLAVLAREFPWAHRLLERAKRQLPSRDRRRHARFARRLEDDDPVTEPAVDPLAGSDAA